MSLFDGEITDLSDRRSQSRLQSFTVGDFNMHDINASCKNRCKLHHERSIGLAVVKRVMCVDILPNDEDRENSWVGGYKTSIDG